MVLRLTRTILFINFLYKRKVFFSIIFIVILFVNFFILFSIIFWLWCNDKVIVLVLDGFIFMILIW